MTLSIVIPAHNEAEAIPLLWNAITDALRVFPGFKYEVLIVDDGSNDASWTVICALHKIDARLRGIRLSRNFGHQSALTAGLKYATGKAIITMDGDLQHPPELLPRMIEQWREGFDVVSMVRADSPSESTFKKVTSSAFYRLMNKLSDVPIKNSVSDFRLLDRRVVKHLNALPERTRFVRGLISWLGFNETELTYTAAPRAAGRTKYSVKKMVQMAISAVSSFSNVPLNISFYAGLAANAVCIGLVGYAAYNKLHEHKDLTEWASTFVTMLFLNGIQLLMIGIIGIYLGKVLQEVKGRPLFVTKETVGIDGQGRLSRSRPSPPLAGAKPLAERESVPEYIPVEAETVHSF